MNADNLRDRFQTLKVWSNGDQRAPHKPLLALWAIGRCLNGEDRMASFEFVSEELSRLLESFGPHRQVVHTEFPFWRMRNDDVWEIDRPHLVKMTSSGDAHKSSLIKNNIKGGLLEEDYRALRASPDVGWAIAEGLIAAHFPESYRDDILYAVGIDATVSESMVTRPDLGRDDNEVRYAIPEYEMSRRLKRHPGFRPAVLKAYRHRCAVCEFGVHMEDRLLAVEAAHIHWHRDAGPSDVRNGLSLCVLHHRLFDRGAFALSAEDLRISVSARAQGQGFDESLGRFDGQSLSILPESKDQHPAPEFLRWHFIEVFQSPTANST